MPALVLNPIYDDIAPVMGETPGIGLGPGVVQPTAPIAAPGLGREAGQPAIATTTTSQPADQSGRYVDVPADQVEQWQKDWQAKQSGEFVRGAKSGFISNASMGAGFLEATSQLLENGTLYDAAKNLESYAKNKNEGNEALVPSIADVRTDSVKGFAADFWQYLQYQAGSAVGTSAPSLVSGVVASFVTANPFLGVAAGAATPSFIQNAGEMYTTLRDSDGIAEQVQAGKLTPKQIASYSMAAAVPMAALDIAGLGATLGHAGFGALKKTIMGRVAQGIATGAISEGGTEGLQQIIQESVSAALGDKTDLKNRAIHVVDSAIGGMAGGAVIGGPGHALKGVQDANSPAVKFFQAARDADGRQASGAGPGGPGGPSGSGAATPPAAPGTPAAPPPAPSAAPQPPAPPSGPMGRAFEKGRAHDAAATASAMVPPGSRVSVSVPGAPPMDVTVHGYHAGGMDVVDDSGEISTLSMNDPDVVVTPAGGPPIVSGPHVEPQAAGPGGIAPPAAPDTPVGPVDGASAPGIGIDPATQAPPPAAGAPVQPAKESSDGEKLQGQGRPEVTAPDKNADREPNPIPFSFDVGGKKVAFPSDGLAALYDVGQRRHTWRMNGRDTGQADELIAAERQRAADMLGIPLADVNAASDEYRNAVEQAARAAGDGPHVAPEFDPKTLTAARDAWDGMAPDVRKTLLERAGVKRSPKMEWDALGKAIQDKLKAAMEGPPLDDAAHEAATSPQNERTEPTAAVAADNGSGEPAVPPAAAPRVPPTAFPAVDKTAKWHSTRDRAQTYIDKKSLGGSHEIVQTQNQRFEIRPKEEEATARTGSPADRDAEAPADRPNPAGHVRQFPSYTTDDLRKTLADPARVRGMSPETVQKMKDELAARDSGTSKPKVTPQIVPEKPATKEAPAGKDAEKWKPIGANSKGVQLFEDERGVRSYVENGARHTEPVALRPTRGGGMEPITDRVAHPEYRTEREAQVDAAMVKVAAHDAAQGNNEGGKPGTDAPEHPGLRIKSLETGKETVIQPPGTRPPAENPGPSEPKAEKSPEKPVAPAPPSAKPDIFANNKLYTSDKVAAARARMRAKFKGQINTGFDPELVADGITLVGAYVEAGTRKFIDVAKAVAADLGTSVSALSKHLRGWYNGARDTLEDHGLDVSGMDDNETVRAQAKVLAHMTEAEGDERSGTGSKSTAPLDEVAPKEGSRSESAGDAGGGPERGGAAGARSDRSPDDAPALPGARGGRGGRKAVHPSSAGGRNGSRVGKGGKRGARQGASERPASGPVDVPPQDRPSVPGANFRITDEVELGKGSESVKFDDNIRAIEILKNLEQKNRRATPDEQRALARYVGWGGLADAFRQPGTNEHKADWKERGEYLESLLTPEELKQARSSTQYAHYTSKSVIDGMWNIAKRLGFDGGLVLENSMGIGNFLGLVPEDIAGRTRFIGIEKDSITARMAKALYPQDAILHSGFEEVPLSKGEFVLSIGNPPFSRNSLRFDDPELTGLSMHNQFFLASLNALRPGGLHIAVVSHYLMDAKGDSARAKMAVKADLVGMIRLPQTAFRENARTDVVTDIVVMQRRTPAEEQRIKELLDTLRSSKGGREGDERRREARAQLNKDAPWIDTAEVSDPLGGAPMAVNKYFAANPGMVLGRMERSGTMYAGKDGEKQLNVKLPKDANLGELISRAIDALPENRLDLGKEVIDRTIARHESLGESLKIALSGNEVGHVSFDEDGKLRQVYERETPSGEYEMAMRDVTPETPWSRTLMLDAEGRWFRLVPVSLAEKLRADKAAFLEETKGGAIEGGQEAVDARVAVFDARIAKAEQSGENAKNGRANIYKREYFPDNKVKSSLLLGAGKLAKLTSLVRMRDILRRQIVLETEDARPDAMEANRAKLSAAYDAYVEKNGLLHEAGSSQLINEMPDGALLQSLEHDYRPEPAPSAKKAAILSKRVVPKYEPPTKAASVADAVSISRSERGYIDLPRVASLLDISEDEAKTKLTEGDTPLAFYDPETRGYEPRDEYLTGHVRRKLEAARAAGLVKNAEELEKVQPERWSAEEVTAHIGANWVPASDYADFVRHLLGVDARVVYSEITNTFDLRVEEYNDEKQVEWGTEGMPADKIIHGLLNSSIPKVTYEDENGSTRVDKELSAAVVLKAKEIEREFSDWIYSEGARRNRVVDIYNDKMNTRVTRQWDGSHLDLPGKVPDQIIQMRRHQKNGIWRGIAQRFNLFDHVVGAGKTFTAIARAMERRRLGLSRKPMIVVPNHLVEEWAARTYELYPGAKVLSAGSNQFDTKNRRRLFARIATGDWDIVIVPHSSFKFIGINRATEERFLEEDLSRAQAAVTEAHEAAAEAGYTGFRKPLTVKQAEALVTRLENRMASLRARQQEKLLTFEQMGVDDLTVDEAHEFKNLFYSTRLGAQGVRGLGNSAGSQKAADLYNKVRVLRGTPTGSVTFLTGTPISNSAVEMYTMMRYLAADELKEIGLDNFDAWRANFVNYASDWEPTESGSGLREVNRLGSSWSNMRAMMELYYSFTDSVTQDDINRQYAEDHNGAEFPIPSVKGGGRKEVIVKPTQAQSRELERIVDGFNDLPNIDNPDERNIERLKLMDRARKVSLDIRAVDPLNPSKEAGGKLEKVADNVARIAKQWEADRGTQLVFLDRSVPKSKGDAKIIKDYDAARARADKALADGDEEAFQEASDALDKFDKNEIDEIRRAQQGGWNAYDQLKQNLIARGMKPEEIRFVQEANSDLEKKLLFDQVKDGTVRVLIGSTPRMGAGTNVQDLLVGLHHVDVTWKPSDIEQREGRIIRQGNKLLAKYGKAFAVEILSYATERTIDAKMWDLNSRKMRTINGIRKYDGSFNMEFEDSDSVSMAEMAALASGDPLLTERVKLEGEIKKLEIQENSHRRKMFGISDAIEQAEIRIRNYPELAENIDNAAAEMKGRLDDLKKEAAGRSVNVEGETYSDRMSALTKAAAAAEAQRAGDENAKYSINVGGSRFTNKESIENAITTALGDGVPFAFEQAGETYKRRWSAAAAISEAISRAGETIPDVGNESKPVVVGKMLGADVVFIAIGKSKTNYDVGLILERDTGKGAGNGKTLAASDTATIDGAPGGPIVINQRAVKAWLDRLESDAVDVASRSGNWHRAQVAAAKKTIADLEPQKGQAFPKEDQLDGMRSRLNEIIQELASRAKDAEAVKSGGRVESVPSEARSGMSPDEVRRVLDRTPLADPLGRLIDAGKIVIETTADSDANAYVTDADGVIHLVAPNLAPGQVTAALLHEAFHSGVRPLIGDAAWSDLMGRLNSLYRQAKGSRGGARAVYDRALARMAHAQETSGPYSADLTPEEFGAYLISEAEAMPRAFADWVRDIIGVVKAWALRRFGRQLGEVTPEQLRALAVAAIRDGVAGTASRVGTVESTAGAPSRAAGIPADAVGVSDFRNDQRMKAHPDYRAAKAGDNAAAVKIARDLVKPASIGAARAAFGADAIYAPVVAIEASGHNAIPETLAAYYAEQAGGRYSAGVYQANRAFHTGAKAMERIANRAIFAGAVVRGGRYVLVDDVSVMGSTLAEMASHIAAGGGRVVGVVTLVDASRTGKIAPTRQQVAEIERRFGDVVRKELHIDPAALTAGEAGYLLNFRDADALRGRVASSQVQRDERLRAKGILQGEEGQKGADARGLTRRRESVPAPRPAKAQAERGGVLSRLPRSIQELSDMVKGMPEDSRKIGLGLLPLNTLVDWADKAQVAVRQYVETKRLMDTFRNKKENAAEQIVDKWQRVIGKGGQSAVALADVMHESTLAGIDPSKTDSQTRALSGYADLRKKYERLSPAAQALYGEVRDAYVVQQRELDQIILDNVAKAMDQQLRDAERAHAIEIERIRDLGLEGEEKKKAIAAAEDKFQRDSQKLKFGKKARLAALRKAFESSRVPEPYFPLTRFGELFVTVRDEMGKVVSFSRAEKKADLTRMVRELRQQFPNADIETGVLSNAGDVRKQMDPRIMADISAILGGANVSDDVMDQIWQRYLETMPDLSIRKRQIHRRGVAGFQKDALRAFGSHMFHAAHQMGRLKYGPDLQELVAQAKEQARKTSDPIAAGKVANELELRHEWVMNPKGSALATNATTLGFIYFLGSSPAAAAVNLSQTAIMGVPILGSRFGMTKAVVQLGKAARDFVAGKGGVETANISPSEHKAMQELYDRGTIDKSMAHDLAGISERGAGYNPTRQRVMKVMAFLFHHAERFNREVTALAAYRLARDAGMTHAAAVDKAAELTWMAHFDPSNSNRPRYLQSDWAKVLLLFKNFQINALYRIFRDVHQTFKGETPEVRREARKQLAGIMGMYALMAGTLGVPLMQDLIIPMFGMIFGDDDDEKSSKEQFRGFVLETLGPQLGGMALDGVPGYLTGVSLTQRLGMPDLWFHSDDREQSARDWWNSLTNDILGPVWGMGHNVYNGFNVIRDGKGVARGIEMMMPTHAKNAMKAWRYAQEGAVNMRGDTIVPQDSIGFSGSLKQAIGFTPAVVAEQYTRNNEKKNMQTRIADQRKRLLDAFAKAVDGKDDDARQAAIVAIQKFNAAPMHVANPITNKTLKESLKTRQRLKDAAENGVIIQNDRLNDLLNSKLPPRVY